MERTHQFWGGILFLFFTLFLLGAAARPGWAQTSETASSTTGGSWTTTGVNSIWNCSVANCPTAGYPDNSLSYGWDVTISAGTGVNLSGTGVTIDSLANNGGELDVQNGGSLTINNNVTNVGALYLGVSATNSTSSTLTVDGTLTNNAGGFVRIAGDGGSTNTMTAGSLVNNGHLEIDAGQTLNLTNSGSLITSIRAGHSS